MEGVLQYSISATWSEVHIFLIFVVELLETEIEKVLYTCSKMLLTIQLI